MSSYIIMTDGAIDLIHQDLDNQNLHVIPMNIQINDEIYPIDGKEGIDFHKSFYQKVKDGQMPTTSMIPSYIYEEYFRSFLEKGLDVLYISMSSQISGTFEQSHLARKNLLSSYPNRQIICLDSIACTHTGGMLVHRAYENQLKGFSIEENQKDLESSKESFFAIGLAMNLNHLRKGGRLSVSSALLGTALNIKPILYFDRIGRLLPLGKSRGLKHAFRQIISLQNQNGSKDNKEAIISHFGNEKDARRLADLLKAETNLDSVFIEPMSPVIATHLGPDAIAFSSLGQRPSSL